MCKYNTYSMFEKIREMFPNRTSLKNCVTRLILIIREGTSKKQKYSVLLRITRVSVGTFFHLFHSVTPSLK